MLAIDQCKDNKTFTMFFALAYR